jgi:HlyD family secretion protein
VNIRVGEYAPTGTLSTPLMLVGNLDTLHVRTDVDENDAWRITPGAKARGSLRGNADISFEMTFVRIEPYVIPKRSLTGDSSERVDTRVLQVLYAFPPGDLPVYAGQQVDVFIEAAPRTTESAANTAAKKEAL